MAGERILIIDDEPGVRSALEGILRDEGFEVALAESGEEGLAAFDSRSFDAVLLDVWLPGIDGLATLERLREKNVDTEVVMISGHGTIETAVNATKLGAFDFVEKPLSLERTLLVLRNALRQRRLERTNVKLLEQLSRDTEILGRSPAAESLRRDVERASGAQVSVLIRGEPGSGRETVARRLHAAGPRPDGPFVDVPCRALDAPAAEQALYGDADHPGRVALAQGGTLYLEDVDRLPEAAQRRLAARLSAEARSGRPLRFMASCALEPDRLSPELAAVLGVADIRVPALRERREDVPLLAERFMRDLSQEYGREDRRLAPETLAALKGHDWPGNVRELKNLMERLLLRSGDNVIRVHDLPEELGGDRGPVEDLYREFPSLQAGLEAFERYYIARVLAQEDRDTAAAAKRLGIDREALRHRLRSGG